MLLFPSHINISKKPLNNSALFHTSQITVDWFTKDKTHKSAETQYEVLCARWLMSVTRYAVEMLP